jgi:hypothetical protein
LRSIADRRIALVSVAVLLACTGEHRAARNGAEKHAAASAEETHMMSSVCDPTLELATEGTTAIVTLRNRCDRAITVLSHVEAGDKHLDWYRFRIVDRSTRQSRELKIIDDRDESSRVTVYLEPGKSVEHRVDLAVWARRGVNGAKPIAPGTYDLTVDYEVRDNGTFWRGRLEAGPAAIVVR